MSRFPSIPSYASTFGSVFTYLFPRLAFPHSYFEAKIATGWIPAYTGIYLLRWDCVPGLDSRTIGPMGTPSQCGIIYTFEPRVCSPVLVMFLLLARRSPSASTMRTVAFALGVQRLSLYADANCHRRIALAETGTTNA